MSDATTTTPFSPAVADVMDHVDRRLGLIQWIEDARETLDQLWTQRSEDADLAAALKKNDIRSGLEWSETESSALQDLLLDMRVRMSNVRSGSKQEASDV